MKKISLKPVKPVLNVIVGYGTGRILGGIVKTNTPEGNVVQNLSVRVATSVIGMMITDKMQPFLETKIDNAEAWYNEKIAE